MYSPKTPRLVKVDDLGTWNLTAVLISRQIAVALLMFYMEQEGA